MFLALKEMRRAKWRFGMLIAASGMLVVLILFQQSLQNGLVTSFVGAIRNQSAPVLVYSVDGQRVIQGSIITPDLAGEARGVEGVAAVGRIEEAITNYEAALPAGRETFQPQQRDGPPQAGQTQERLDQLCIRSTGQLAIPV